MAKSVGDLEREQEANNKLLQVLESDLTNYSQRFAEAQRNKRLASLPVDVLKNAGATNIRYSLLRENGYKTIFDLNGVTADRLTRIRGIGPVMATAVARATREIVNHSIKAPISIPEPELVEEFAEQFVETAIHLLDARTSLQGFSKATADQSGELARRFKEFKGESRFLRWLTSSGKQRKAISEKYSKLGAELLEQARSISNSESFLELGNARSRILEEKKSPPKKKELVELFRKSYADVCALLESRFPEAEAGGDRPKPSFGRLPIEIVEQVENLQLNTNGLRLTLRRYQEFGAKYMIVQQRTMLGDEMGLGKTIEAITAAVHCWNNNGKGYFLVVCPAGITINWIREISERTSIPAYLLHGPDRETIARDWMRGGGFAVISYQTLNTMWRSINKWACENLIDLIIADEAHYVKNPSAQRTSAVKTMARNAKMFCLMSGTPLENHPREFCSLIDLLWPGEGQK
ncbi:MAG: SNF2-related protein, partial [Desulfomonile sp.]